MSESQRDRSAGEQPDIPAIASDLRMVVGRLVRRFRADRTLPSPQISALIWILRRGPKTTSELAALEGVRQQSMAHTVGQLESAGLVHRRPDAHDGRKQLVELTAAGQASMDAYQRTGESWVAEAIAAELSVEEQRALARAIELLGRLVDD